VILAQGRPERPHGRGERRLPRRLRKVAIHPRDARELPRVGRRQGYGIGRRRPRKKEAGEGDSHRHRN
jgi:hypothetical protein